MKGFSGRFKQFYAEKGAELLKHPSVVALFKRQVNVLFEGFRQYLRDREESSKTLKLRDFKRILEDEGFIIITNKR